MTVPMLLSCTPHPDAALYVSAAELASELLALVPAICGKDCSLLAADNEAVADEQLAPRIFGAGAFEVGHRHVALDRQDGIVGVEITVGRVHLNSFPMSPLPTIGRTFGAGSQLTKCEKMYQNVNTPVG